MTAGDPDGFLPKVKETLDACGFQGQIHSNIQQLIWDKLFTNVSLSALTGVLQVPMGFIASDEYAWSIAEKLIQELLPLPAVWDFRLMKRPLQKRCALPPLILRRALLLSALI